MCDPIPVTHTQKPLAPCRLCLKPEAELVPCACGPVHRECYDFQRYEYQKDARQCALCNHPLRYGLVASPLDHLSRPTRIIISVLFSISITFLLALSFDYIANMLDESPSDSIYRPAWVLFVFLVSFLTGLPLAMLIIYQIFHYKRPGFCGPVYPRWRLVILMVALGYTPLGYWYMMFGPPNLGIISGYYHFAIPFYFIAGLVAVPFMYRGEFNRGGSLSCKDSPDSSEFPVFSVWLMPPCCSSGCDCCCSVSRRRPRCYTPCSVARVVEWLNLIVTVLYVVSGLYFIALGYVAVDRLNSAAWVWLMRWRQIKIHPVRSAACAEEYVVRV